MLRNMIPIKQRKLLCGAINLWVFFGFFIEPYDIPEYRPMWMALCTFLIGFTAIIACSFLFKKANKHSFTSAFNLTMIGFYFFGYYTHEKHLSYAYYGVTWSIIYYSEIIPVMYEITTFGMFLMLAWNADVPIQVFLLIFGTAHTMICGKMVDQDPEIRITYKLIVTPPNTRNTLLNFHNKLKSIGKVLFKFLSVYMALFILFNIYNEVYPFDSIDTIRNVLIYELPFSVTLLLYVYEWVLLFIHTSNNIRISKGYLAKKS